MDQIITIFELPTRNMLRLRRDTNFALDPLGAFHIAFASAVIRLNVLAASARMRAYQNQIERAFEMPNKPLWS